MEQRPQTCPCLSLRREYFAQRIADYTLAVRQRAENMSLFRGCAICRLTINMDSGKHLVYPPSLPKGRPARGKGDCVDPAIFFFKRSCTTPEKDAFIVARRSHKYGRGFLQVFGPADQKILNVLKFFLYKRVEKRGTSLLRTDYIRKRYMVYF